MALIVRFFGLQRSGFFLPTLLTDVKIHLIQIKNIKLHIVTDIKNTEQRVYQKLTRAYQVEIYISENQLVFTVCRRFHTTKLHNMVNSKF